MDNEAVQATALTFDFPTGACVVDFVKGALHTSLDPDGSDIVTGKVAEENFQPKIKDDTKLSVSDINTVTETVGTLSVTNEIKVDN